MSLKNPIPNRAPGEDENCAVQDACRHRTFWYNVSEDNRAKHVRLHNLIVEYLKDMNHGHLSSSAADAHAKFKTGLSSEGIHLGDQPIPLSPVDKRPKKDADGMLASLLLKLPDDVQKEAMRLLELIQQEREELEDELQGIYYDAYQQVGQYSDPSPSGYETFYKNTINAFDCQKESATQVEFRAFKDRALAAFKDHVLRAKAKAIMCLSPRDWAKDAELRSLYEVIVDGKNTRKQKNGFDLVSNPPSDMSVSSVKIDDQGNVKSFDLAKKKPTEEDDGPATYFDDDGEHHGNPEDD